MRLHSFSSLAVLALAASACAGGGGSYGNTSGNPTSPYTPPSTPAANTVVATASITFSPASLTVTTGTTVTFAFESVGHNVFFDAKAGAPSDIPQVLTNTSVTRTFSTAGTFGFECHVHPGMRGTVIVQ